MSEEEIYEESNSHLKLAPEVPCQELNENLNINETKLIESTQFTIKKSEEEIQEIKDKVMKLKTDANEDFNKSNYLSALNKYTIIVKLAEEIDFKEQLCILNSNKGLCFIKMNEDKKAIECFTKSLDYDNKYIKAYVNRMLTLNKLEDFIEALDDFNKIKEIDYNIYLKYRHMEKELNYKAEIKKKQMTEEVMGKLKEVGNSFLGLFGLSTNNFQMQQNASGGYSINFQK